MLQDELSPTTIQRAFLEMSAESCWLLTAGLAMARQKNWLEERDQPFCACRLYGVRNTTILAMTRILLMNYKWFV